MRNTAFFILLMILAVSELSVLAQKQIEYKQVDTIILHMQVYLPENMDTSKKHPSVVFFFGGGWKSGSIKQFEPHAQYFSKRGMVCFLVDYRVSERHHTTPFESLMDAKSAIRYIREHADAFFVDTTKIVAAGGSAGGHLAAATAIIDGYNEKTDNMLISCKPNALVLFNPVIDNGPAGYGYERIGEAYKSFSPLHNIKAGLPPTIFFLGTNDGLIPVETAKYYKIAMEKTGNRCELFLYEGQGHGFFNYKNPGYYKKTVEETDKFLRSIEFLKDSPIIDVK